MSFLGKVAICLDNDDAGQKAMERLCEGGVLGKVSEASHIEFLIAQLPEMVKDPAEFLEDHDGGSSREKSEAFHEEVIDTAIDWISWQTNRILSRYNATEPTSSKDSFGGTCQRLSEFLASLSNPAERLKRTHDVANLLAHLVGNGTESETSSALQIQLESDLVDMVTRKVASREWMTRRAESRVGYDENAKRKLLSDIISGGTTDDYKMPVKDSRGAGQVATRQRSEVVESSEVSPGVFTNARKPQRGKRRTSMRRRSGPPKRAPLIPHFRGFDFENESDAQWLGIDDKVCGIKQ